MCSVRILNTSEVIENWVFQNSHPYKGNVSSVVPRQGAWDKRDKAFWKAMEIKNWVILNNGARLDQRKLEEFANGMCKAGYYQGMKIAAPSQIFNIRNQQDLDNKVSFEDF